MEEGRDAGRDDDLFAEANNWYFRLASGDVTQEEKLAFGAWLEENPAHLKAWEEVNAFSMLLRKPAMAVSGRRFPRGRGRRTVLVRHVYRLASGAAALVFLAFILPGLLLALQTDFSTSVGEHKAITLADGTQIDLDSDTALKVDLSDSERRITILKGEAYFDVFKDPRPFIVVSGENEIRDIGTSFDVSKGDLSTISVKTGIVDVGRADHRGWLRLTAGQAVDIEEHRVSSVRPIDFDTDVGWRSGKINFRHMKLSDLITKMNRYRRGRIVIINPRIADERVSGSFNTDQPETAIRALKSLLKVQTYELTPALVLLR